MKSRAARLALLVMFVVALGVTAYLFRKGEADRRAEAAAGEAFSTAARGAARGTLELRAAQQAYVATGQADDFWASKVAATLGSLRDRLTSLRTAAVSSDARSHIDAATGSLDDFAQMDRRAREYVRTGQKVVASDLIFSNAGELTDAAVASIDKAVTSELTARNVAAETFERRQDFALIAAAAVSGARDAAPAATRPERSPRPLLPRAERARACGVDFVDPGGGYRHHRPRQLEYAETLHRRHTGGGDGGAACGTDSSRRNRGATCDRRGCSSASSTSR